MLVSLFRQGGARGASLAQIFKLNVVLKSMHKNMLLPTHIQKRLKRLLSQDKLALIQLINLKLLLINRLIHEIVKIVKMLVAVEKHQEGGEDN